MATEGRKMNSEKFEQLILAVRNACQKTDLNASADAILESARAIYNSENIENSKQSKKQFISEKSTAWRSKPAEPASDKQLNFLKKLGIPVVSGLTKREAMALIKEKTGGKDGVQD